MLWSASGQLVGGTMNSDDKQNTKYLYTGQEFDAESELYYYNARYYNPRLGRFISRDPVLGRDGDSLSRNGYVYVKNNPLRYVDPSGETTKEVEDFFKQQQLQFIQQSGQSANSTPQYLYKEAEQAQIDLGNIALQMGPNWQWAMDHPYLTGAGVGVSSGLAALGGVTILTSASTAYLGGAGTACVVFCSQADKTIKILSNTEKLMSSNQRQMISDAVQNSTIKDIFSKLYQETDRLPGGTAGAIKYEIETGELLSKAGHIQKGLETIGRLNKVMQNGKLGDLEVKVAQTLLDQLNNVIKK